MKAKQRRLRITAGVLLAVAIAVVAGLAYSHERAPASDKLAGAVIQTPVQANADAPAALRGAVFPLKAGATGRYLVDQRNVPFLIVGDSPQALIVNLSMHDARYFLADRRAAGFNSIWVNLLCNKYTGGRSDGSTYDGIRPFTTENDLATPDEAYFSRVDEIVRLAGRYGLAVFLDPIETGGWRETLLSNGIAKDYAYGRYLGNRYKRFPNIVWFNGNDFQTWRTRADNAAVQAVARGIKDTDPGHIQTVQLNYHTSGSLDASSWRRFITLNAAYTYYPTYAQVLKEYNRRDFLPIFMVEANYEYEHEYTGLETLRRQEYWSLLSGAAGQLYGNKHTWQFLDDWADHLDTKGTEQFRYVTDLFASRPWFKLIPDQDHALLASGFGTFSTKGSVNDNDYATAARTPDGKLVIAYLPTIRTVTVDMRKLSGPVHARWYDPTRGVYSRISSNRLDNAGMRRFRPPGKNADGDGDWVLVLTAA